MEKFTLENTRVASCGYTTLDTNPTTGMGLLTQEEADNLNKDRAGYIARTILEQMGGAPALVLMLDAKNFTSHSDEGRGALSFSFKGSKKTNHLKVILTVMDTYSLRFSKVGRGTVEVVDFREDIYNDNLKEVFFRVTGLVA
jgi:hypothetical protein